MTIRRFLGPYKNQPVGSVFFKPSSNIMFVQILLIFGALFIILIAHILVTYIINVRKAKKLGLPIANASILPWWGHKLLNLKVESKKDVIVEFFKTHDLPMVANIDGFRFSIDIGRAS